MPFCLSPHAPRHELWRADSLGTLLLLLLQWLLLLWLLLLRWLLLSRRSRLLLGLGCLAPFVRSLPGGGGSRSAFPAGSPLCCSPLLLLRLLLLSLALLLLLCLLLLGLLLFLAWLRRLLPLLFGLCCLRRRA